jgi:hypothetical protein
VFLESRGLHEIEFAADERLDALRLRVVIELDGAVKIAVVGEGEGAHSKFRRPVHEPVNPARAVEQTVVGVDVEMDEIFVSSGHRKDF